VGGVAISSALFQAMLDSQLRKRIDTPDAEELIKKIRHSARLVGSLPPAVQRQARDAYAVSLKAVFIFAACSTFLAYIVRLPIPDKVLEHRPKHSHLGVPPATTAQNLASASSSAPESPLESDDEGNENAGGTATDFSRPGRKPKRRLSTFESVDGFMDLESDSIGGSARAERK